MVATTAGLEVTTAVLVAAAAVEDMEAGRGQLQTLRTWPTEPTNLSSEFGKFDPRSIKSFSPLIPVLNLKYIEALVVWNWHEGPGSLYLGRAGS